MRFRATLHAAIVTLIVLLAPAVTGCGLSGMARISYIDGGQYSYLFENAEEPLRIAVLPIRAISNIGDADASFWAARIRNDIDEQLKRAARKAGGKVVLVAPPEDADQILEEADRQAAGIVETDRSGGRSALVGRDLFIAGQLRITVEVIQVAQQVWVPSGSSGYMQTVHVPVRTTSADCSLRGVSRRGTTVVTFTSQVVPIRTVGRGVPPPLADDIRRAVTQVSPQFVRLFFAERVDEFVRLKSSSSEPCKQAVSVLVNPARDDPASLEEAISSLRVAIQEDPEDHRAYFALGVALEKLDRLDEAVSAYKAALQINGKDPSDSKYPQPYSRAIARVNRRIENQELAAPTSGPPTAPKTDSEAVGREHGATSVKVRYYTLGARTGEHWEIRN